MSGRTRVLIVDDEPPILRATSALLRELDYETHTHGDAATIHAELRRTGATILLQDVRMPGLDVRALLREIRGDDATRGTRVVLFSAGMEARELGRELGLRVLDKPFKPAGLVAALTGE